MIKRQLSKIGGIFLIAVGISLFLAPDISEWLFQQQTEQYVDNFQTRYKDSYKDCSGESCEVKETKSSEVYEISGNREENADNKENNTDNEEEKNSMKEDSLYQEILVYNQKIYEEEQAGFQDAWSYEQTPIILEGLEDGKFGYMEIPVMDVVLPLYIGASGSNMSKGAAVLGQTSIPIGGENTNSVIAAHRGWSTGSFLKEIEKVSVGDMIFIINPWERLTYQVESIDIIEPWDSEAVKIQEGRDMITICTCHPYMSHGQYRYLLYCIRNEDVWEDGNIEENAWNIDKENVQETTDAESTNSEKGYIISSNGIAYKSSDDVIRKEKLLRRGSAFVIICIILISFIYQKFKEFHRNFGRKK